jgi:hypothetical protein
MLNQLIKSQLLVALVFCQQLFAKLGNRSRWSRRHWVSRISGRCPIAIVIIHRAETVLKSYGGLQPDENLRQSRPNLLRASICSRAYPFMWGVLAILYFRPFKQHTS